MTDGTFRLSPWQISVLVFTLSLCVTPLQFPGVLDRDLGRDGWLAALPGIAVGLWGTLVAWGLVRRHPGRHFDRIAVELLGPFVGGVYLVALILLFAAGAAVNLGIFCLASTATELTHLPPAYPAVLTAAIGLLAAYYGPEVVARTGEIVAPLVGVGLLAIFVPLAMTARMGRLLPIGVPHWDRQASADTLAAAGTMRGFLPLLVLGPFCRPLARRGALCAATAAAGGLIAASIALPVALFGDRFTARLRYPFLAATGTLTWDWLPVNNLLVLTMLVWHAIALVVFSAYLWLGAWLLRRLWTGLPWVAAVIGLGAIECAGAAAQVPSDLRYAFIDLWNEAVVVLGVLIPTLLWLLARRRAPAAAQRRGLAP